MNTLLKSTLILGLIVLVGCTNNSQTSAPTAQEKPLLVQGDGQFGVVNYGDKPVKSFLFTNNEASTLTLSPSLSGPNATDFDLLTLGCSEVLVNRNCLVKVLFNSLNKVAGTYTATLTVGQEFLNIQAVIESVIEPNIEMYFDNQLLSSVLDLGIIESKELRIFSLKVKNNSPTIAPVSTLASSNENVILLVNQCQNLILKPNQVCYAKGVVKGQSVAGVLNNDFTFAGKTSSVTAQNQVSQVSGNLQALTSTIELGDFTEFGDQIIKALVLENTGNGIAQLDQIQVPAGYSTVYNNCASVKPGKKCVIRFSIINDATEKGQDVKEITINDNTVSVVSNQVDTIEDLNSITLQTSLEALVNQCQVVNLSLLDDAGVGFIMSAPITLSSNQILYSDSNCQTVDNLEVAPFTYQKTLFFKTSNQAQSLNLTVNKGAVTNTSTVMVYSILQATNSNYELITGSSQGMLVVGGKAPYTYLKILGSGEVVGSQYLSTAAGLSEVKVIDSLGQEVVISINNYSPMTTNVTNFEKVINQSQSIMGAGGKPPYTYEKVSGVGNINSSGEYVSSVSGVVQLKVKDSLNQEVLISGENFGVLTVSNPIITITPANQATLSIAGGKIPYSFEKVSGVGEINSSTYVYSSSSSGAAQFKVKDLLGQEVIVNMTVNPLLAVAAGACTNDTPESVNCQTSVTGGVGVKTYQTNVGTISATGLFKGQCLNNLGQSQVTVTDELNNTSQINLSYPCVYRSCNQILADTYGLVPGNYWIDPDGLNVGVHTPVKVYCDQTADQGGWTLVLRGSTADNLNFSSAALGTLTTPSQNSTAKLSDSVIDAIRADGRYRMICSSYKRFLAPQSFNLTVSRTSAELRTFADIDLASSPTPSTLQSNVNNVKFGDRAGSGVGGWYLAIDGNYICNNGTAHSDSGLGRQNLELYVKTPYNKLPTSCLDAKNKSVLNQSGTLSSGYWTIDPDGFGVGLAPFSVYCDQETADGGWTLYARFDGDDQPSQHYGSGDFGTLASTTAQYSLRTSKLTAVSKLMTKTGTQNKTWTFATPQVMTIPTSGGFEMTISERGYDNCSPQRLTYNTTGCWNGAFAGPAVGVTDNNVNGCASTGNWEPGDYFYGRAGHGSGQCVPRGKWFSRPTDAIFMPIQEWYVK